jgi:hypothetical protein
MTFEFSHSYGSLIYKCPTSGDCYSQIRSWCSWSKTVGVSSINQSKFVVCDSHRSEAGKKLISLKVWKNCILRIDNFWRSERKGKRSSRYTRTHIIEHSRRVRMRPFSEVSARQTSVVLGQPLHHIFRALGDLCLQLHHGRVVEVSIVLPAPVKLEPTKSFDKSSGIS